MTTFWRGLLFMGLGSVILAVSLSQAWAGVYIKRYHRQNANGYVIAESWYGRGTIRARVRATRRGPQVRLPGGSWIYCEINCTHTLRINTLDFWENMGRESDGVGYLRYERSLER